MFTGIELFECPVRILLCGWKKERSLQKDDKYSGRIFSRILEAAVRIKKPEEQLRPTTRDHRTRDAKCTEVDGGSLECLL